jgi:hypothetical protein
MIRLIAIAGFLALATSAQAITPAPIPQQDGMVTQVRLGCGPPELMVSAWPEPPFVIPAEWPAERTAGAPTRTYLKIARRSRSAINVG